MIDVNLEGYWPDLIIKSTGLEGSQKRSSISIESDRQIGGNWTTKLLEKIKLNELKWLEQCDMLDFHFTLKIAAIGFR